VTRYLIHQPSAAGEGQISLLTTFGLRPAHQPHICAEQTSFQ